MLDHDTSQEKCRENNDNPAGDFSRQNVNIRNSSIVSVNSSSSVNSTEQTFTSNTNIPSPRNADKSEEEEEDQQDDLDFEEIHFEYSRNKGESMTVLAHTLDSHNSPAPEFNQQGQENQYKEGVANDAKLDNDTDGLFDSDSDSDCNSDSDSDDWKEMATQLNYSDIYNNKGEKISLFVHSNEDLTLQNKATASGASESSSNLLNSLLHKMHTTNDSTDKLIKNSNNNNRQDGSRSGYTRIADEEQASKYNKWNKKFEYLFQNEDSNFRKLRKASDNFGSSVNSSNADLPLNETLLDDENSSQIKANEEEDVLNYTNKLESTRSMLSDSQKFAYAALIQLIIVQQHEQLAEIRGSGSIKTLKRLATAHKSFTRWEIDIMEQLYEHLDIQVGKERESITNLGRHGIQVKDVVSWLDINLTKIISNPLLENKNEDLKIISTDGDNATIADDAETAVAHESLENQETLQIDVRWSLICDLFLNLLSSSIYDARSRTLLLNFANALGIDSLDVFQFERRISDALEADDSTGTLALLNNATTNQKWDETDILDEHRKRTKKKRMVAIGLATIGGGLVIGLSAGILAPVIGAGIAAGLSTIGIGGTSTFLAGAAGSTIVTSTGVLSGMKIGKSGMTKRVGSVKTFELKPLHSTGRVNLIITVSGWMSGTEDDVRLPFSTVDPVMGDLYSILWEPELLTSMGQTIGILATEVLTQSIQQVLGSTVLVTLMGALQLPLLLTKLGYLLDNPWNVSLDRAWAAGLVLADTLRRRKLGVRPVTLVGFSLGARLIYSCLLDLAKTGDYGLIENVYLFGSPFSVKIDQIALARSVVSGRFVNGYSKKDWILGYLFRATSGGLSTIAGLSPIKQSYEEKEEIQEVDDESKFYPLIENIDCSDLVTGHMEYRKVMPKLLKKLDWEVLSDEFIEIDDPDPKQTERERKLVADFETAREKMKKDTDKSGKKKKGWFGWMKPKKKEWWEMYEEGSLESEKKDKTASKEESAEAGEDDENFESESEYTDNAGTERSSTPVDESHNESLFNIQELVKEVQNIEREALDLREFRLSKNKDTKEDNKSTSASENTPAPSTPKAETEEEVDIATPIVASPVSSKHNRNSSITSKSFDLNVVKTSSNKEDADDYQELKPFRLRSVNHGTDSPVAETNDKKSRRLHTSPSLNFGGVVAAGRFLNNQDASIANVSLPDTREKQNPEPKSVSQEDKIDYGDEDEFGNVNGEGDIMISYDDDGLDDVVIHKPVEKPPKPPVVEEPIDYGDEDEFPSEEREVEITFA